MLQWKAQSFEKIETYNSFENNNKNSDHWAVAEIVDFPTEQN